MTKQIMSKMNRLLKNNALFVHFLMILIYILFMINYSQTFIKFSNPLLNVCISIICLFIPFILLVHGFRFKRKRLKIVNAVFCIIPILISTIILFFESLDINDIMKTGIDPSFEKVNTIELSKSKIVAYRTDGGATTDFGIVVRQEMNVFPGILIVRQVYNEYHKYDIGLKKVGDDAIKLEGKMVVLKKYVYI